MLCFMKRKTHFFILAGSALFGKISNKMQQNDKFHAFHARTSWCHIIVFFLFGNKHQNLTSLKRHSRKHQLSNHGAAYKGPSQRVSIVPRPKCTPHIPSHGESCPGPLVGHLPTVNLSLLVMPWNQLQEATRPGQVNKSIFQSKSVAYLSF